MITWKRAREEQQGIVEVCEFWREWDDQQVVTFLGRLPEEYDEREARIRRLLGEFLNEWQLARLWEQPELLVQSVRMWKELNEGNMSVTVPMSACNICARWVLRDVQVGEMIRVKRELLYLLIGEEAVDEASVGRAMGELYDARCVAILRVARQVNQEMRA